MRKLVVMGVALTLSAVSAVAQVVPAGRMKWIALALAVTSLASLPGFARETKARQAVVPDFRPYGGEGTITATFFGSNVPLLRDYLVRSNEDAAKGEFETTAEHQARVRNLHALLTPIDPGKLYAFPLKAVSAKYDADRQEWRLTTYGGCKVYPGHQTLWECLSVTQRTEGPGYMGQNAYGATTMIDDVTYNDIRFAVSTSWPKVREIFREGGLGEYGLDLKVPMPVEQARQYAGATLEVYGI